jgi:predicted HTH domain antitoxin
MSQTSIPVPDSVSEAEAKLYLALKLYEVGRLSCGQAAEVAGYSKRAFLELMGTHGVAIMDYSVDELEDDLYHA